MGEFTKEKIAFAIGLLAVLFTLTPFLDQYGTTGFDLVGVTFSIYRLYLFMSAVLGLAVYSYGIQFTTERTLRPAVVAGDVFYVVAIVAPALFAALFVIAEAADAAAPIVRSPSFGTLLQNGLSAIAGAGASLAGYLFGKKLDTKEKRAEAAKRELLEVAALRRAEDLFKAGHFDLAVVEAFKALEVASRGIPAAHRPTGRRPRTRDWFQIVSGFMPEDLRPRLEQARRVRNMAAHSVEPVVESTARETLNTVNKVLAILAGDRAKRCPECGSDDLVTEQGSDSGFAWERSRCRNCGFVDLG